MSKAVVEASRGEFTLKARKGIVIKIDALKMLEERSRDDIAAFEASYTTPSMLSTETGAHLNTIRAVLQSEGVQPFRPNGLHVGPVYLRNVVEPFMALLKSQGGK